MPGRAEGNKVVNQMQGNTFNNATSTLCTSTFKPQSMPQMRCISLLEDCHYTTYIVTLEDPLTVKTSPDLSNSEVVNILNIQCGNQE